MKKKTAISLGSRCPTTQYCVKNGLRPLKKDGYKTCPFDIMITNAGGVIDCIKTDFKYFCDPSLLKIKELGQEDGEDRFVIEHKKYGFKFNHEAFNTGEQYLYKREDWPGGAYHFVNDNFKYLVERYEKRVSNFRFYCESDYYVTFLLQFPSWARRQDELVGQLHDAIRNRYPDLEYEIKVIPSDWTRT